MHMHSTGVRETVDQGIHLAYGVHVPEALWNPSHRSRVNSGNRFDRGFDRIFPVEC